MPASLVTTADLHEANTERYSRLGYAAEEAADLAAADTATDLRWREYDDAHPEFKSVIERLNAYLEEANTTAPVPISEHERRLRERTHGILDAASSALSMIYAQADVPLPVKLEEGEILGSEIDFGLQENFARFLAEIHSTDPVTDGELWAERLDDGDAIEGAVHPRWRHLPSVGYWGLGGKSL